MVASMMRREKAANQVKKGRRKRLESPPNSARGKARERENYVRSSILSKETRRMEGERERDPYFNAGLISTLVQGIRVRARCGKN